MEARKPRRPSTRRRAPIVDKQGLQSCPMDPSNSFELVYDKPLALKNLFTYLKNVKSKVVFIKCEPTKMLFISEQCSVYACLNVTGTNWYYCEKPVTFCLLREKVDSIFSCIDKTFYKISIKQSRTDTEHILITLNDSELDKECVYKVMLSYHELQDKEIEWARQQKNLISFTLTSKQLRKSVSDIMSSGCIDEATYYYIRDRPLMLKYSRAGVDCTECYLSDRHIQLKTDLPADQIVFKCDFNVRKITALANSIISDYITVQLQQKFSYSLSSSSVIQSTDHKMVLTSILDTNLTVFTHVYPLV